MSFIAMTLWKMATVKLNDVELAILKSAARKGDADQGFTELLLTLVRLTNDATGEIFVSQNTLELIQRYGGGGGRLGWSGTLFSVFGRSMGATLGRKKEESHNLTRDVRPH